MRREDQIPEEVRGIRVGPKSSAGRLISCKRAGASETAATTASSKVVGWNSPCQRTTMRHSVSGSPAFISSRERPAFSP